jgi:hypothetical protein
MQVDGVVEEAYVVLVKPRNGKPKLPKIFDDSLFFTLEDARVYLNTLVPEIRPHCSIYRVEVTMCEEVTLEGE